MWRRRLALVVVAAAAVACDTSVTDRVPLSPPAASPLGRATLVVGLVGTLSGPDSWRGEDAFEGADLGVHELNRTRPPGLRPFELRPLDDRGDPLRAAQLVGELAALQSTVGVVYAGPPEGLAEATGDLARAGIPALLCYGDPVEGTSRSHVFQVSPPAAWQVPELVAYLTGDRGYRNVGAIAEASAEGDAALRALRGALAGAGARSAAVRYAPGSRNVAPLLARLRQRHVEAVVVQGSPAAMRAVLDALRRLRATYRSTPAARLASAAAPTRRRRLAAGWWHPQVAGFDLTMSRATGGMPYGTVAVDTYARAPYLPLESSRAFDRAFRGWWGTLPLGWEQRAYDAALLIGSAAKAAQPRGGDLAARLEALGGRRFGALPVVFSATDHVAPPRRALGLWVVARPGAIVAPRRPAALGRFGWVPLARTFTRRGSRTSVLRADWPPLFGRSRYAPRPPRYRSMRWGVTTPPSDPLQ